MAFNLYTNNGSSDYTHNPTPKVVISKSYSRKENTDEIIGLEHRWTISGVLTTAGGAIDTQVAALEAAYEVGDLAFCRLRDEAVVKEQIPVDEGVHVESVNFPVGKGPEWASKREYEITITGIDYSASITSTGDYAYTITYDTDQSLIQTRSIRGTLKDYTGKDSITKTNALVAAESWGTWSGAYTVQDSITTNETDTVTDFNLVHKKYWTAFPSSITNAQVSNTINTDNMGMQTQTISGFFEGSEGNCTSAINTLRPSGSFLASENIARNDYTNRTNFSMKYASTATNDIVYYQQVITIIPRVYGFIYKRILGGVSPVRQSTSLTSSRASQSGVIQRLSGYPSIPAPLWGIYSMTGSSQKYTTAQYRNNSLGLFTINYTYEFEFDITPAFNLGFNL